MGVESCSWHVAYVLCQQKKNIFTHLTEPHSAACSLCSFFLHFEVGWVLGLYKRTKVTRWLRFKSWQNQLMSPVIMIGWSMSEGTLWKKRRRSKSLRQRRNDERASNSPIVRITHTPFLQVPFMNMSINTPVLFGSVELRHLYMYTCKLYIKCRFLFVNYLLV